MLVCEAKFFNRKVEDDLKYSSMVIKNMMYDIFAKINFCLNMRTFSFPTLNLTYIGLNKIKIVNFNVFTFNEIND